jgi:hypothetical protein
MPNFFASYPGVIGGSNASVGPNGSPIPADATLVAGENPSGNLQPLQTDASGALLVDTSGGSAPVNLNGSFSQGSISSATTITKPANAVGFLLEADSSNTDFMRWCDSNSTASATNGMKMEPGRDTGFMPMSHNLSICPNSGTQMYTIQWVLSS